MVSFYDAERWERAEKKRNADFARLLAVARAAEKYIALRDKVGETNAFIDMLEALAAVEDFL